MRQLTTSFVLLTLSSIPLSSQADDRLPRTMSDHPDLNGIWQALSPAHGNLEAHSAYGGQAPTAGALDATPAGLGVVEGGVIPYRPEARARQTENFADREARDPLNQCYLPGVPRANYLPMPLQIIQDDAHLFIAYEFAQASRTVYLDRPDFRAPIDSWMGHSLGRWEGDTLVVNVTDQVADTWLDEAGNHHGPGLVVEERYSLVTPNHIRYQATLEDPDTYTRPWTISLLLYRILEEQAQLLEFKCVEFVEERMYGHLRRGPPSDEERAP